MRYPKGQPTTTQSLASREAFGNLPMKAHRLVNLTLTPYLTPGCSFLVFFKTLVLKKSRGVVVIIAVKDAEKGSLMSRGSQSAYSRDARPLTCCVRMLNEFLLAGCLRSCDVNNASFQVKFDCIYTICGASHILACRLLCNSRSQSVIWCAKLMTENAPCDHSSPLRAVPYGVVAPRRRVVLFFDTRNVWRSFNAANLSVMSAPHKGIRTAEFTAHCPLFHPRAS